jgi:alpha-ketoglutarate-dependent taurine dioxygenase
MVAEFLNPEQQFVRIIQGGGLANEVVEWCAAHLTYLENTLSEHGGLLLRGFNVDVETFRAVSSTVCSDELDLRGGNSPRRKVAEGVYLSTEYPPHLTLNQHHERSFARRYPRLILFYCDVQPMVGGETPVCSSRAFSKAFGERPLREYCRDIRYVRTYHPDVLPWQKAYVTSERQDVVDFCRGAGIYYEWNGDALRTEQSAPGTIVHPDTGELSWFNQAHIFNPAFTPSSLPKHTDAHWDDGSRIDERELARARQIFKAQQTVFSWQQGDILILDNILASHGRLPFEGPRRILVTLRRPADRTGTDALPKLESLASDPVVCNEVSR